MLKRVSSVKKSMVGSKKDKKEKNGGGDGGDGGGEGKKSKKKDGGGGKKGGKGGAKGRAQKGAAAIVGNRMDVDKDYVPVKVEKNPKTRKLILEVLDHLTIFQELSYDQKEAIMLCMTEVRTPTGDNLIVQGETGNAFYIVESGQFNIFVDGKQVATSEEGGSFGELALVMDQLRAATVTAAKDSLCWKLDRAPFRKYMASSTAGELTHIIDGLKKIQLLAGLSENHLSQLALHTSTEQFSVGSRIICKDEVGDKFYMMKEGAVRCANIGRQPKAVGYPTVCYTVGREDFVALLGNLSEAMERSLAVAVIKSLPDIAADPVAAAVVRDNPATFEQLLRKEYKAGDVVSENVADLTKLIVVRKGTIELETPGSSNSWFQMEKRNLAKAKDDVLVYEFDPAVITEERTRKAQDAHLIKTLPKFTDLEIKRTLGMGTFGRVKLTSHTVNGVTNIYALKMLVKHMMAEMKQTHAILYERRGGELFSRLTCFAMDAFPMDEAKFYACTTLDALCYIHSKSTVYRDLKPENILIDAGGYIRIVDFGFAKGYRFDVDLWAFGCLVYEMHMGATPFAADDPSDTMQIFKQIQQAKVKFLKKDTTRIGGDTVQLCQSLLDRNRKKRLGNLKGGGNQIKEHPYFAGTDFKGLHSKSVDAPFKPPIKGTDDMSLFDDYDEDMDIAEYHDDQRIFDEFASEIIDDSELIGS
ncbi:cAMP-dependent protein kinase [Aureococcus anophagefferens]|nr:cAMP-dependent protein kinase [Aureococcus anophagefferens]